MVIQYEEPKALSGTVITPGDVAQDHEERLQGLERMGGIIAEAFPHLRDSLGLDRIPHQFSTDEMSGINFTPGQGTIDALIKDNATLRDDIAKLTAIVTNLFSSRGVETSPGTTVINPESQAPEPPAPPKPPSPTGW